MSLAFTAREIDVLRQAHGILSGRELDEEFYHQKGWQQVSVAVLGLTLTIEAAAVNDEGA